MIVIPKLDINLAKFFTLLYDEQNKLEERPSCFNGLQLKKAYLWMWASIRQDWLVVEHTR